MLNILRNCVPKNINNITQVGFNNGFVLKVSTSVAQTTITPFSLFRQFSSLKSSNYTYCTSLLNINYKIRNNIIKEHKIIQRRQYSDAANIDAPVEGKKFSYQSLK